MGRLRARLRLLPAVLLAYTLLLHHACPSAAATGDVPGPAQAMHWAPQELHEKMRDTARRSLRFWQGRPVRVEYLQHNLRSNERLLLVAVIDNRVYLDAASKGVARDAHKLMWTYAQLAEVLSWLAQRGVKVPDCVFTMSVGHTPVFKSSAAPAFSLCNAEGFEEVPMPNMYFQTPSNWSSIHDSLLTIASNTSFEARKPEAFYRGFCRGFPGSLPRVEVATIDHPLLDVGLFTRCQRKLWAKAPVHVKLMLPKVQSRPSVSFKEFGKYRYQIHMPGGTNATYSRTLQFTLGMGSVILKWDNPYYEFYYEWLEEGKHYKVVNASTVVDTVQELNDNPQYAAAMARATSKWFREHLHPNFLQQYWFHLLSEYASMQDFQPSLDMLETPCACLYAYNDWTGPECPQLCGTSMYRYKLGVEV